MNQADSQDNVPPDDALLVEVARVSGLLGSYVVAFLGAGWPEPSVDHEMALADRVASVADGLRARADSRAAAHVAPSDARYQQENRPLVSSTAAVEHGYWRCAVPDACVGSDSASATVTKSSKMLARSNRKPVAVTAPGACSGEVARQTISARRSAVWWRALSRLGRQLGKPRPANKGGRVGETEAQRGQPLPRSPVYSGNSEHPGDRGQ